MTYTLEIRIKLVNQRNSCMGINGHIFQNGTEATGRLKDLRLGFLGEIDDLGIAAAFEVEDPLVIPTMAVIADQGAIRIGGEGCCPGAGQAEEDGGITVWSCIGRNSAWS